MPVIYIEEKNTSVKFPDGTPPEVMEKAIRENFYSVEEQNAMTTFAEREKYRLRKGQSIVSVGGAGWKALQGTISNEDALKFETDTMKEFTPENDEKFSARNLGEKFVGATTELAPYMFSSVVEGVKYGGIAAGVFSLAALAGGQAGPQVLAPEEVVTVPGAAFAGWKVGQAYGAWTNAARVEGGNLYLTLIKEGIDPKTARLWAEPAGYMIGAIELLQVGQIFNKFIPGGSKLTRGAIRSLIRDSAKKGAPTGALKKFFTVGLKLTTEIAKRTGLEIAEEEAQEIVTLAAETGAHLNEAIAKDQKFAGPTAEEAKDRLVDTFTQGLLGFPLLGLPGSVVSTVAGRSTGKAVTPEAQESLETKLQPLVEEAKKFDNVDDFIKENPTNISSEDVQDLGFDNHELMMEGAWDEAQREKAIEVGVPKVTPEVAERITPEEVAVRAEAVGLAEIQERITEARERFVREPAKTKAEIKAVQTEIIEQIEASELEPKDRAKFIRSIKNIQTQQQLVKVLPEIQERITGLQEKATRRRIVFDIKRATTPTRLKKIRPEFRDQIKEIVDDIDLSQRTGKKLTKLKSLANFLREEPESQIPPNKLKELEILQKKPLKELTTEELEGISSSVKHLTKLSELKDRLIIKGKLRRKAQIAKEAIRNVSVKTDKLQGSINGLDSSQQEYEIPLWQKIFGVDSYNAELKTQILDGRDNGVIQQVIYREIDDGVKEQLRFMHAAEDFFTERLEGIDLDKWSRAFQRKEENVEKFKIKISKDRTISLTRGERIAFNLHSRNINNNRHLITGGFAFEKTPSKINKLTQEDVDTIAGSLTAEELRAADAIHEYLNTIQKDRINAVSLDLVGDNIAKEIDYFPIRTNFLDRFKEQLIKVGNFSQKTLEGLGIFKERQPATNAIILEDAFTATYKSIKSVGAYVGLAGPLRSAKTLLQDNNFQIASREAGMKSYLKSLDDYLRRVEGESIRLDNVDKITQEWINRLDVSILGLNPFVMLKQPISFMAAATEMDARFLLKGNLLKSATKLELAEMKEFSPHLRDRLDGNVSREMGEISEVGRPKRFFTKKEVISKRFMAGIRNFDQRAITGIWRAVKAEVAERSPELRGDEFLERVAERAWFIIRRTQPTFHIKDRSTIGMSPKVWTRLLTKYSSQRNKNWMMIRRAFERYNLSEKTNSDKAKLASALSIITIVSPLFLIAIDELRGVLYDREEREGIFTRMITRFITVNFGIIYFLGPAVSSLFSKIQRGTWGGYDITNPLSDAFNDIVESLVEGVNSIKFAITQEKYKVGKKAGEKKWVSSLKRFVTSSLDNSGKILGIPMKTVRKFLAGGFRLVTGERRRGKKRKTTKF